MSILEYFPRRYKERHCILLCISFLGTFHLPVLIYDHSALHIRNHRLLHSRLVRACNQKLHCRNFRADIFKFGFGSLAASLNPWCTWSIQIHTHICPISTGHVTVILLSRRIISDLATVYQIVWHSDGNSSSESSYHVIFLFLWCNQIRIVHVSITLSRFLFFWKCFISSPTCEGCKAGFSLTFTFYAVMVQT